VTPVVPNAKPNADPALEAGVPVIAVGHCCDGEIAPRLGAAATPASTALAATHTPPRLTADQRRRRDVGTAAAVVEPARRSLVVVGISVLPSSVCVIR